MQKQKRMKQITAILLIIILLAIVGSTIFFAVTGSQLFWISLFLMFFFPIFLWAMSFAAIMQILPHRTILLWEEPD